MTQRKTLDQVYTDRNLLAVAYSEAIQTLNREGYGSYKSGWHPPTEEDDADVDEWAVVWATTPEGQVSWHVPRHLSADSYLPCVRLVWDGHDREERNTRLRRFAGIL